MVLAGRVRAAGLEGRDQRHRLHVAPAHADREPPVRHRRPRPGHLRAHALRRPHLARRRPGGDADGDARRRDDRRDRRHLARRRRRGADVADRPVPVAAAAAAAADPDLPVPRRAEGGVRPRGRRLHPDRAGDRRLSLDAGGAPGAGAVLLAAREGVRRGGARARRVGAAPGHAPHPAQLARAGDRRRHDRRRRGDHRRVDAVVPRPRLSARHPDLGPDPVRQQGVPRHRAALGSLSRHRRSSSRCCASTSSATACATRSIRAGCSDVRAGQAADAGQVAVALGRAARRRHRRAAAADQGTEDALQDRRRLAARGRRRRPDDRPRRDRLRRRRVGLRQDGDGDDGAEAAADAARQDRRRRGALAGARPRHARATTRCAASAPRRSRSSSRSR